MTISDRGGKGVCCRAVGRGRAELCPDYICTYSRVGFSYDFVQGQKKAVSGPGKRNRRYTNANWLIFWRDRTK